MIIDLILDRKDLIETYKFDLYEARRFYKDVMSYGDIGLGILKAMDYGDENDVKKELYNYLVKYDYNLNIKTFIDSVQWLPRAHNEAEVALLEKRDDLILELAEVIASLEKVNVDFTKIEKGYMCTELSYDILSFLRSMEADQ